MANDMIMKIIAFFLFVLLVFIGFLVGTTQGQDEVYNPYPDWFDETAYDGTHYFLHTDIHGNQYHLKPEPPNITITNEQRRAKVESTGKIFFPFAREDWSSLEDVYWDDPKYAPQLSIVINSGDMPGKELNFEIWFDFDGLAQSEADVDAKAVFDTYTTWKRDDTEIVDLSAKEIIGEMKDFDNSTANVGNIKLVVWRTDDQNDTLFIYCGAYKSMSWMIVPFKFHRDFYVPPNGEDPDGSLVPVAAIFIVVGVLGLAVIIYYIYWSKKQKRDKEEDDDSSSRRKGRSGQRKRKDQQSQKAKRFYRKNR